MVVTLVLEWRDVIPGAPYLTQFFTEKDEKVNKTDWQNIAWIDCLEIGRTWENFSSLPAKKPRKFETATEKENF